MRVAMIGGTPSVIGRGGLEVQMSETGTALARAGIELVDPWSNRGPTPDLLHVFGADPSAWNMLRNSNRVHGPIVLSSVLVLSRGRTALVESLQSRLTIGGQNTASMRRSSIRAADAVVALHVGERDYLRQAYSVDQSRIRVIGNGSSAASFASDHSDDYVVVGTIGPRKRQYELASEWPLDGPSLIFIGDLLQGWTDAENFMRLVSNRSNLRWLGHLPQQDVWDHQARAAATISASEVEGESLALLDCLRLGKPVLVVESPASASLTARFGDAVIASSSIRQLIRAATSGWLKHRTVSRRPPSWDDVAIQLLALYTETSNRRSTASLVPAGDTE